MNITRIQQTLEIKLEHHFAYYNHLVLINKSLRKELQRQGLHDLLNRPLSSSPSYTSFP